jgi:RNA polymerase sigma-54 factor
MKPGLSLRVSQHLALTPQLQQSIRLLQMSTLELGQEIEQMLDENPFLERAETESADLAGDDAPPESALANPDFVAEEDRSTPASGPLGLDEGAGATPEADHGAEAAAPDWEGPTDWAGSPDEAPHGEREDDAPFDGAEGRSGVSGSAGGEDEDAQSPWERAGSEDSLSEHLHRQALPLRLDPVDRAALDFLIDSLDDDGYLSEPLERLAEALCPREDAERFDELVHRLTVARGLLQSLEPTGVGAQDLAECLRLQVRERAAEGESAAAAALDVLAQPLEWLARRDFKRLAAATGRHESELRAALALIARLEPKPGRRFAQAERLVIVPDVIVTADTEGAQPRYRVQINPEVLPRLRVHDIYARALREHKGEGSAALSARLQEARWFIKNIQQRFDTILRVSRAIVERQKSFFVHGELAMRPLVLREIADELGLHESTVSRVTTAKYMATPRGTFELKYFFGSGLDTEAGGSASSTAVRALIRQFIDAEDPAHPLSDGQIADMLKEQGIACARRTVAKYREAMRIAPAPLRKTL